MLNMANGEFAISPAFFEDVDNATLQEALREIFPHFSSAEGMDRILSRCLASLVYHREHALSFPAHHVVRSIPLYRQSVLLDKLIPHVKVVRSWETTETLTGIPPHIKSLVDIGTIKEQQGLIVDKVYSKVMEGVKAYFEERAIGGGQLTEARIRNMIRDSMSAEFLEFRKEFDTRTPPSPSAARAQQSTIEEPPIEGAEEMEAEERAAAREVQQYPLRVRNGALSRLPNDFEFPKAGVYDLWLKWNIGDTQQGVPPHCD
jgi:hypothetical protein